MITIMLGFFSTWPLLELTLILAFIEELDGKLNLWSTSF